MLMWLMSVGSARTVSSLLNICLFSLYYQYCQWVRTLAEGPGPVTPRARARVRKLRSSADEAPYNLLRSVRVMDVAVAVAPFKRFGLGEMMFAHQTRHPPSPPFSRQAA